MANLGSHGFPLMLCSDWDDMLYKVCREGKGESIWTSMQLGTVLPMMAELAKLRVETGLDGSKEEPQAKIWLNTQSWSVLSGMGDKEKQILAMDSVKALLDTELGIKKIHTGYAGLSQ